VKDDEEGAEEGEKRIKERTRKGRDGTGREEKRREERRREGNGTARKAVRD
jgi:hypothetical protein